MDISYMTKLKGQSSFTLPYALHRGSNRNYVELQKGGWMISVRKRPGSWLPLRKPCKLIQPIRASGAEWSESNSVSRRSVLAAT